jgi:hypothetical protein
MSSLPPQLVFLHDLSLVAFVTLTNPARLADSPHSQSLCLALLCPSCNDMDSNGLYSVNQDALQRPTLTDFFVPDEESNLQQPPANLFALDGTGGNAGNPDSLYPYLGTMNGPFADLTDYQSFDQTRTTGNNFGPINEGIAFGSPFSFVQRTLLQGSALNVFAPNTTAVQNTGLEVDAPFQHSELG